MFYAPIYLKNSRVSLISCKLPIACKFHQRSATSISYFSSSCARTLTLSNPILKKTLIFQFSKHLKPFQTLHIVYYSIQLHARASVSLSAAERKQRNKESKQSTMQIFSYWYREALELAVARESCRKRERTSVWRGMRIEGEKDAFAYRVAGWLRCNGHQCGGSNVLFVRFSSSRHWDSGRKVKTDFSRGNWGRRRDESLSLVFFLLDARFPAYPLATLSNFRILKYLNFLSSEFSYIKFAINTLKYLVSILY